MANMRRTEPLTPGSCEWCGIDCPTTDSACSLSCESQLHRLEATQGRLVIRTLKKWRRHRGRKDTPGEGAISEVAKIVDRFNRTDRERREEAGRARRERAKMTMQEIADQQARDADARAAVKGL